jgi:hypothetical protein
LWLLCGLRLCGLLLRLRRLLGLLALLQLRKQPCLLLRLLGAEVSVRLAKPFLLDGGLSHIFEQPLLRHVEYRLIISQGRTQSAALSDNADLDRRHGAAAHVFRNLCGGPIGALLRDPLGVFA